jgi:hypothetical protein
MKEQPLVSEPELCVNCNKNPISIKKRKLCPVCYRKMRKSGEIITGSRQKVEGMDIYRCTEAQMEYAASYLQAGSTWRPAVFRLPPGGKISKFTPSFWDSKRQAFVQVVATRQAYGQYRDTYRAMKAAYQGLPFLVVTTDNREIDLEGDRVEWPEKE